MAEYAIFHRRDEMLSPIDVPLATVKFDKGVVTIKGAPEFIESWVDYFQHPEAGWSEHLKEPQPLLSLFGRMTYQMAEVLEGADSESRYEEATKAIDGKPVSIGGGSYSKVRIED